VSEDTAEKGRFSAKKNGQAHAITRVHLCPNGTISVHFRQSQLREAPMYLHTIPPHKVQKSPPLTVQSYSQRPLVRLLEDQRPLDVDRSSPVVCSLCLAAYCLRHVVPGAGGQAPASCAGGWRRLHRPRGKAAITDGPAACAARCAALQVYARLQSKEGCSCRAAARAKETTCYPDGTTPRGPS
jgi:hypothetical protein